MMQILVNAGKSAGSDGDLRQQVEDDIAATLSRFSDKVTRVEVHLGDESADKGSAGMRCAMEARPAGQSPVAVTHNAATITEAYRGAARKLKNLLDTRFSAAQSRRARESIRYLDQS
jgi:hypothetical protein